MAHVRAPRLQNARKQTTFCGSCAKHFATLARSLPHRSATRSIDLRSLLNWASTRAVTLSALRRRRTRVSIGGGGAAPLVRRTSNPTTAAADADAFINRCVQISVPGARGHYAGALIRQQCNDLPRPLRTVLAPRVAQQQWRHSRETLCQILRKSR